MAIVVRGDALSEADVQKAFDQIEEVDVVVSNIGGTPGDPTADSQVAVYNFRGPIAPCSPCPARCLNRLQHLHCWVLHGRQGCYAARATVVRRSAL